MHGDEAEAERRTKEPGGRRGRILCIEYTYLLIHALHWYQIGSYVPSP